MPRINSVKFHLPPDIGKISKMGNKSNAISELHKLALALVQTAKSSKNTSKHTSEWQTTQLKSWGAGAPSTKQGQLSKKTHFTGFCYIG